MSELELLQLLSGNEYRLYTYILLWRASTGRSSEPHVTNIMDKLGMTRSPAFNLLRALKEKGVL